MVQRKSLPSRQVTTSSSDVALSSSVPPPSPAADLPKFTMLVHSYNSFHHRAHEKPNFKLRSSWRLGKKISHMKTRFPSFESCCTNKLAKYYFTEFLAKRNLCSLMQFLSVADRYRSMKTAPTRADVELVFKHLQRVEAALKHPGYEVELLMTKLVNTSKKGIILPIAPVAQKIVSTGVFKKQLFNWNYQYVAELLRSVYPLFMVSTSFIRFVQLFQYMSDKKVTLKDFTRVKMLGKGGFGRVVAVKKKDSKSLFAMKEIPKTLIREKNLGWLVKNEMTALSRMRCPFALNLNYAFQSTQALHLVFEMCSGGDLLQHLEKAAFSLPRARFYAAEVILGLQHIHDHGYLYRDLKPSNVLLTESGHCKITDLGLVIELPKNGKCIRHSAGTPGCWSPEIMSRLPLGKTTDYWTLGVLVYTMLYARSIPDPLKPFRGKQGDASPHWSPFCCKKIDQQIARKDPKQERIVAKVVYPEDIDQDARDLISKLLKVKPEERLGHGGVQDIKNHPFFAVIDWAKLANMEIKSPFIPRPKPVRTTKIKCSKFHTLNESKVERDLYKSFQFKNENEYTEEIVEAIRESSLLGVNNDKSNPENQAAACCIGF